MIKSKDFVCEKCGECCKYTILLNDGDIKRIEEQGFKDFFFVNSENEKILKKNKEYCIFNSKGLKCKIYEFRLDVCRIYPFNNGNEIDSCKPSSNLVLKKYKSLFKNL